MRTHTLQNGNKFRADAFEPQEGDDAGDAASGSNESDDTVTLQNGNVFRSNAFLPQEEEVVAEEAKPKKPARKPATRRQPTWDLEVTPEAYLTAEGLDAPLSALALVTLGVSREEYEELEASETPAPQPES